MSIVAVILSLSSASPDMSEEQHKKALEYLSLNLALRDRREIIRVLCQHNPDHLTQAIRDGVAAYDPMIRQVHQAVDLSATVGDFEVFMNDMIKMSKPGNPADGNAKPPSVEDYVNLLHRHQHCSHRFLHQVAKNGKEVTKWFNDYVHEASAHFRTPEKTSTPTVSNDLAKAFTSLDPPVQTKIRTEIDAHAKYLTALHDSSASRISDVISSSGNKSATPYGPGAYLARWQQLLDSTLITPATAEGPLRKGASKSVKEDARRDVDGEVPADAGVTEAKAEKVVKDKTPEAPSTEETVKALGEKFRGFLREKS